VLVENADIIIPERPVFFQDIGDGDVFRDSTRHSNCSTTENYEFICFENSVPSVVKYDNLTVNLFSL